MIAAIFSVVSWLGSIITSVVALGLAIKLLLIGIVVLILPIILKNTFLWIMQKTLELASSGVDPLTGSGSMTYQFTGLGAYIADSMLLPQCLSIILTAVAVRFILRAMRILQVFYYD